MHLPAVATAAHLRASAESANSPEGSRSGGRQDPDLAPDGQPSRRGSRRSRRDWLVDIACFFAALAFGVYLVAEQRPPGTSDLMLAADITFGLLACVALWWRRRWPVEIAMALVIPAAFSDLASGAVLIALFSVAVHRPRRVVAAVAAVHLVSIVVYLQVRADPDAPFVFFLILLMLLLAAILSWGMAVRARRQLIESLRQQARWVDKEQQLLVDQARQLERNRIAREMHDVLAHRISLISMHAGALEFRRDADSGDVHKAAAVIRDSAHQALEDLRQVIGILREPPTGDAAEPPQPTLLDLPALVEESRLAGGVIGAEYRVPDIASVPATVGRTAYRIVQEALTNARKHAPGARVDVVVGGNAGGELTVEVRSRRPVGTTASVIPGGGTGLVGLAERATLAGGRLEHGRADDGDFVLRAWLPWPA